VGVSSKKNYRYKLELKISVEMQMDFTRTWSVDLIATVQLKR
jgi:hypothetical protein